MESLGEVGTSGLTPVLVPEIVPVRVPEMVPLRVPEIVPVFVPDMVPDFANVVVETAKANIAAHAMDLAVLIIFLLMIPASQVLVGSSVCLVSLSSQFQKRSLSDLSFSRDVPKNFRHSNGRLSIEVVEFTHVS